MIGSVLGNYRITQKLGNGGVGDVWKAVDLTLDREVALKILRPELAAIPQVVARFRTEALALGRLNHPNVATIYGFHTEAGTPFIVMEYIAGQTLHVVIRGFGPMRSVRALPHFFQALDAIEHAHDHGIVHRDLKASNVMLSQRGIVKMLDFGIARVVGSAQLTQGDQSIGTPAWMAPEQVLGEGADVRTDVYALGLLLYWLVTARLPFESDSHFELQRAHVKDPPPPPREFSPDLPEEIDTAILRALAKRPEERFATVADFRVALSDGFVPAHTIPMISDTIDVGLQRKIEADAPDVLTPTQVEVAQKLEVNRESPPVGPRLPPQLNTKRPRRISIWRWLPLIAFLGAVVFAALQHLVSQDPSYVAPTLPNAIMEREQRPESQAVSPSEPPAATIRLPERAPRTRQPAQARATRAPSSSKATRNPARKEDVWVIRRR